MLTYFQRVTSKGGRMAYKTDQLKQLHRQKIKDYFYQNKICNKNVLSEDTGISKTTCTTILKELMKENFIVQKENYASTGGRPSKQYQLYKDYGHSCLIHLKNGELIEVEIQVRNLYSEELFHIVKKFPTFSIKYLYEILDEIFHKDTKISTIAVSIPGVINDRNRVVSCDIKELENRNIEMLLAVKYDVKVVIENDVNLVVLGYHKGEKSLVFIYQPKKMYTGCGIMLNHQLYRGSTLFAGEVGYLTHCAGIEPKDYATAKELLMNQITAIICVLNPEIIVINSYYPYSTGEILDELKKNIDVQHLPKIQIVDEFEKYIFDGLMEASIDIQRNHLKVKEIRKV